MTILTPVRRQLTAQAKRELRSIVDQWTDHSSGHAAVMGRGIKRGMILRRLEEIAKRDQAIPRGVVQVPPRGAKEGPPPFCAMAGFEVDLDELIARRAAGSALQQA